MKDSFFLPYQARWIKDESRYKIVEKSRRTGFTFAQAYEDVREAGSAEAPYDVWFSSADESAAVEYIRYCARYAKILQIGAEDLGEIVINKKDDIKARSIEFANGRRIYGLSSNPKGFRSKGGKLVLDEFAFHPDQEAMWKAAKPIVTWGYPVRVISTYNGKGNRYYRMVHEAKQRLKETGSSLWSLHRVTIVDAVNQGLADKILGQTLTNAERKAWLAQEHESCGDDDTWDQEYMCNPTDSKSAWLAWEMIVSGENARAGRPGLYEGGETFIGWDIARRRHYSVLWVVERIGDIYWTREVVRMQNWKFSRQLDELDRLMEFYNVRRACLDQTGMGESVVEQAQDRHGSYRVEGVVFSGPTKQVLATDLKQRYEDRQIRAPEDRDCRAAHHAVRKLVTAAGNARFDAEASEAGHADEFWAHALAIHAATGGAPIPAGSSVESSPEIYVPKAMGNRRRVQMFGLGPERR